MGDMMRAIRSGEKLCGDIRERFFSNGLEYLVFLFSRDEEINYCTVKLLPVLRKRAEVSRFIIVVCNKDTEIMLRDNVMVPYSITFCSGKEAHDIGRYCTEITRGRKKKERILINGTDDPEEYRYKGLLGINGINAIDITAMAVFDFGYVPGQEETDEAENDDETDIVWETETGSLEELENCLQEGKRIYESIRSEFPDTKIYMCTYHGSGDIYLTGLYLKDRMRYDNVTDCVVVVASEGSRKLMELFDLKDVIKKIYVLRGRPECNKLLYYVRNMGFTAANAGLISNDYGVMRLERMSGVKGIDFNTLFQKAVFFSEIKRIYADMRVENSDEIFDTEGIRKGKTVLLAPYAATAVRMQDEIWTDIARFLTIRGYDVMTNVSGSAEEPVEGTRGISIPYSKIVDFLDKAGGFIGIRSGLCDIISGSSAEKVVLYPPGVTFHYSTCLNYFSLRKMYDIKNGLMEIEAGEDKNSVIRQVLSAFEEEEGNA